MAKYKIGDRVYSPYGYPGTITSVIEMPKNLSEETLEKYQEYEVLFEETNAKFVYRSKDLEQYKEPEQPKRPSLFEEYLNQYLNNQSSDNDEAFLEMATIAIDDDLNINVNPETDRLSIAYFKVFNAESFRKATKVARLHFKDSGMEYHKDRSGKQQWELNSREVKRIVKLLKANHTDYDEYTNWQVACYQWNLENGLIKQGMNDYFSGKYDHVYDNDSRLKEAYVPSDQEMPKEWVYDKSKGK